MRNLLYLAHRLPYPPNKGDKIRSFHLLRHLAERHRVFLGTFIDDPADEIHVERLRGMCADLWAERLYPRAARLRSIAGLLSGEALALPYYRNGRLREWIGETIRCHAIDTAVVFSSPMAQYVVDQSALRRILVDFVDVDSAKWRQYAPSKAWPLSWAYGREAERLLAFERTIAKLAARSFFVTRAEKDLFTELAPESAGRIDVIANGVDAIYFSPVPAEPSPFSADELPIVFTGAMDYWPNVDGAGWFASEVLPRLRERWPRIRFHIVGMRPSTAVRSLVSDTVVVSGTVPDIRPYLQHAAVVVAPLRIARGIQNKVLEAMAMARPVVVSAVCASGIEANDGLEFLSASGAEDFVARIDSVLRDPAWAGDLGKAARTRIRASYDWTTNLAALDRYIEPDHVGPVAETRRVGAAPPLKSPIDGAVDSAAAKC